MRKVNEPLIYLKDKKKDKEDSNRKMNTSQTNNGHESLTRGEAL